MRPRVLRSLASKFSIFAATLVFWVVFTLLAYDLRQDHFNLVHCLLLAFVVVLVAAAISRFTTRLLSRPLKILLNGMVSVKAGKLEPIAVSRTGDEIEFLGETFNEMVESLAAARKEMEQREQALERRIREQAGQIEQASKRGEATLATDIQQLAVSAACDNKPPESASQPDAFPGKTSRDKARILVVEDNPVNQKVVTAVLRKNGYSIELANDGSEALAKLEREADFDLILMDVQMPVLDGLEATRLIRNNSRWNNVPIIAMTAHAMNGDKERCLEAGMDGYISKPVHPSDLLALLDEHLGLKTTPR